MEGVELDVFPDIAQVLWCTAAVDKLLTSLHKILLSIFSSSVFLFIICTNKSHSVCTGLVARLSYLHLRLVMLIGPDQYVFILPLKLD